MLPYHRYYDAIYSLKDYAGEAEVISGLLLESGRRGPGRLLDVGCGTGNHALSFSLLGWSVTGIDIDADSVEIARGKKFPPDSPASVPTPEFRCCEISDLEAKDFTAVVALFHVVNYIESVEALDILFREIWERLAHGQALLFDCWNGLAALREPPRSKQTVIRFGDETIHVASEPSLDRDQHCVDMANVVVVTAPDGGRTSFSYEYRSHLWTPQLLCERLARAGFDVQRVSSWKRPRAAASERDWKLLFTSTKRV